MEIEKGIKRYVLLLLGAADRPIPSFLHLQRELFIVSEKDHGKITNETYLKRGVGAGFNADADIGFDTGVDIGFEPTSRLYGRDPEGNFHITPIGKREYNELVRNHRDDLKFDELLSRTKIVRELYDSMSEEEILYLFST